LALRAVVQTKVQASKSAHGQAHQVGLLNLQPIHHTAQVLPNARLRIVSALRRHIRRRIAACAVHNAAVAAREEPDLRLPTAVIARKLVHKNQGSAAAGFFIMQLNAIVRGH
jgi:hypothetical protein